MEESIERVHPRARNRTGFPRLLKGPKRIVERILKRAPLSAQWRLLSHREIIVDTTHVRLARYLYTFSLILRPKRFRRRLGLRAFINSESSRIDFSSGSFKQFEVKLRVYPASFLLDDSVRKFVLCLKLLMMTSALDSTFCLDEEAHIFVKRVGSKSRFFYLRMSLDFVFSRFFSKNNM